MDMTGLHDTVFNAVGEDLNKDQLKQVYAALPDHIRGQARLHGIGDTCVRDEIYVWLQAHGLPTTETSYEFEGKAIEDIERCDLTFRFASITDMIAFMQMAKDFDNDKMGIRGKDGLDLGQCKSARKFVAAIAEEGGNRLTVVKKEVETV